MAAILNISGILETLDSNRPAFPDKANHFATTLESLHVLKRRHYYGMELDAE
jgi:hypothetical protein